MNYFAHSIRFLDLPWFVAGTALPDWMSVIDRGVRLKHKRLESLQPSDDPVVAQLAAGALQHVEDDRWFHKTRAFAETTGMLTRMFRDCVGPGDGFRCGFVGHVACELLLDSILDERHPGRLDRYYDVLGGLDGERLAAAVGELAGVPVDVGPWLPRFCSEQFLRDYSDSSRLRYRLNQVLKRIKLDTLPDEADGVIEAGREIVRRVADDLLPPARFVVPQTTIDQPRVTEKA